EQAAGGRRADVDGDDLAIAVGRDVGNLVALHDHREREGPAHPAADPFVAREERTQIVLVTDRAVRRVDDADRIVVVVRNDERTSIARDAETGGVGAHVDADTLRRVTEAQDGAQRPAAAHPAVSVYG